MSLSSHIMIASTSGRCKRRKGHESRAYVLDESLIMVLDLPIPHNIYSIQSKADLVMMHTVS
jgi:hypothetical protein